MAAQREPDQVEIISGIKGALNRQKSNFSRRISNVHKLRYLDQTFQALGKVAEAVVKGKYGPLRDRYLPCWSAQWYVLRKAFIADLVRG